MGIAESVLNRLGSVRELIVIARSSSFSLAPHPDPREVARKLGVQYLVQGSVQLAGTRLRVNAQLVAVLNREIWSLSMDRNLDDVFAMQDAIASRVAEKHQVSLSQSRPEYAAFGTEAYPALLHGRSLVPTRKIPDVESSIVEFSRALPLAPSFSAAMNELAAAKLLLSALCADFHKQESTLLPELKALVSRAIELDPGAGASYYLRAQPEGADRIVRRSVRDPDVDTGFVLQLGIEAMVELALQRHKAAETRDFILSIEAVDKEQGRVVISDENWTVYMWVATLQKAAGNLPEAKKIAEDNARLDRTRQPAGPAGHRRMDTGLCLGAAGTRR